MSKTSASSSMSKTSGAASSPLASPAASKQSDFDDTSDWLTSRIGISARERRHDGDLDVDLNTSDRDTSDRDPNCNPSTTATFHSLYSLSPSHSSASPGGILKNCAPLSSPSHAASSSKGVGTVTRALQIECVRTYNNPHDGYTVYVFKCVRALYGQTWEIRRRFRDFQLLQTRLGKVVDAHTELLLPPKRMFGNNSDSVVAERKLGLEKYLNLLVKVCDPAHHSSASPSKTSDSVMTPAAVVAAFIQMPGHGAGQHPL